MYSVAHLLMHSFVTDPLALLKWSVSDHSCLNVSGHTKWKYNVGVSNKVASEWKQKVGVSNKVLLGGNSHRVFVRELFSCQRGVNASV